MRKVRIALGQQAFKMHGGFDTYKAKFEALLSAHYTAAVILHDRALTLAQFEPERYDDPNCGAFAAEQVEVRADAAVSGSQANVDVAMADGATVSARCEHPLGSFENPLSRAQIEQNSAPTPRRSARRRCRRCHRGGRSAGGFGSVRKLMDLLRARSRAAVRWRPRSDKLAGRSAERYLGQP